MALVASFVGKRVLVTGGAKGIGRAIVERLVADNADVTVIDRNENALKSLREQLPAVKTLKCDVGNWDEALSVVQSVGPVDHLVNSAGIFPVVPLPHIKEKDVDEIFNINLKSAINISQVVASSMLSNKIPGSIVNISSLSSIKATSGLILYSATKAALNNVAKTMALELGRYQIRVNNVCPSPVDTDMNRTSILREKQDRLFKRACIPRLVTANEVADLALFLLSSKAAMITGQSVFIDGGLNTN